MQYRMARIKWRYKTCGDNGQCASTASSARWPTGSHLTEHVCLAAPSVHSAYPLCTKSSSTSCTPATGRRRSILGLAKGGWRKMKNTENQTNGSGVNDRGSRNRGGDPCLRTRCNTYSFALGAGNTRAHQSGVRRDRERLAPRVPHESREQVAPHAELLLTRGRHRLDGEEGRQVVHVRVLE